MTALADSYDQALQSDAQADWQRYQRDAARAAATAFLNWIHGGAVGLPHRS